jgi:tRNA(Met) C34 N-acetyltransferase TmcA
VFIFSYICGMKNLKTIINPAFKPIFSIDSKYLILVGESLTGKFFAACQKAAFVGINNKSNIILVCDNPKYALSILTSILKGQYFAVNKTHAVITLKNNSKIKIRRGEIDMIYGSHADMVIIQSANYIDEYLFQKINNTIRNGGQMIITTNEICPLHWLHNVSNSIESSIVNVSEDQFTTISHN